VKDRLAALEAPVVVRGKYFIATTFGFIVS
jgi:hypothetical protein